MNFIKGTKGSTWEKYVGMNCRKILYQNSRFQNMLSHPSIHRPMGNHQAHISPFWLQVCRDMERQKLFIQASGTKLRSFLYGFPSWFCKSPRPRSDAGSAVCPGQWLGITGGRNKGRSWGSCMAKAPLCKWSLWLQTTFSMPMPMILKGWLNVRLFTPCAWEDDTCSAAAISGTGFSFWGSL